MIVYSDINTLSFATRSNFILAAQVNVVFVPFFHRLLLLPWNITSSPFGFMQNTLYTVCSRSAMVDQEA